jgi:hypothetical protein
MVRYRLNFLIVRFQEEVEFEVMWQEEDKRPFKVKDRLKGPLWKG